MKTIAVVGGGASGMMAAITAASGGAHVILLEHKDRIGKKILSTGNGRCNFTNIRQEPICYHCEELLFPWRIVQKFTAQDTVSFFLQLGIYSKNRNGYLYPNSDQASAVLDALRMELSRLKVEIRTGAACREIVPKKNGFSICVEERCPDRDNGKKDRIKEYVIKAERVILCAGSKAFPASGSDGSGYSLAKGLGHSLVPVLPALVQLKCKEPFFKSLAGVRANGMVSVYAGGECLAKDTGEIQLVSYGISGIPVFQVSRYAAKALYEQKRASKKGRADMDHVTAVLDFMPDFTAEQTAAFLKARAKTRPDKTLEEFFVGLFHKKLSELWINLSGISRRREVGSLTEEELLKLSRLVKQFQVTVTGTNSFEQAQVCRGGVDTTEVDPETLESKIVPGLYFAGEILDVDGMCGGYNLQWAWSSGYVAGKEAR